VNEHIVIDIGIPPSVNKLYFNAKHGRVMTDEGRRWKTAFFLHLLKSRMRPNRGGRTPENEYKLSLIFYAPQSYWYTKDMRPKKRDVTNLVKITEDTLSDYLRTLIPDFDDCWFFKTSFKKEVRETQGIGIRIY